MDRKRKAISASEIAQFHFCPVSWYLQRQGFRPASTLLKKGKKTHRTLGIHLNRTIKIDRSIFFLRLFALVLFIIALGLLLLGEII